MERLRDARIAAGYSSAAEAARALGVPEPTYASHENGTRGIRLNALRRYAEVFNVPIEVFIGERSGPALPAPRTVSPTSQTRSAIATPGPVLARSNTGNVPILGLAIASEDGRFVMNGEKIGETFRPPILENVREGYAVYVHGTSMSPRYEPGELVWANPHIPVRRDDYVVVQIAGVDGTFPVGFVKRFVSFGPEGLVLSQFNPAKELRFASAQVQSVNKIVLSGAA